MRLIKPESIRVESPEDPSEWIKIRRLSGRQTRAARRAAEGEALEKMRVLGGEFVKELGKEDPNESPIEAKARKHRIRAEMKELEWEIDQFDIGVLLIKSLESWSLPEPPGEDPLDQIDEDTAEWIAGEIIRISRPRKKGAEKKS